MSNHSSTLSSVSSSPSISEADHMGSGQQQNNYNNDQYTNDKFTSNVTSNSNNNNNAQNKNKHPNNLPYDPLLHTNSKPPYSFR